MDEAVQGIRIYRSAWRKFHPIRHYARTWTLILPEPNPDYEAAAARYIDRYLQEWHCKHFLLIAVGEPCDALRRLKSCAGCVLITPEEMRLLLQSFTFFKYAHNSLVLSLDEPQGRKGSNIFANERVTAEDVIRYGILASRKNSMSPYLYMHIKMQIYDQLVFGFRYLMNFLPPALLVRAYYHLILKRGQATYTELLRDHKAQYMYPAPYSGTGDVYLTAMMLQKYADARGIDNFFVPVVGKSNVKVCALFGLETVSMGRYTMDNLMRFLCFCGISDQCLEVLHHAPINLSVGVLDSMRNVKGLNFFSMLSCGVFQANDKRYVTPPQFSADRAAIEKRFIDNGLKIGKTVLLAPYSYTLPKMKRRFWEEIAEELTRKGYTVCTNSNGKKEKPIKGTVPIFLPYAQIVPFLELAGGLVSIRSGLCEVISSANCKKVVLYLDGYDWNGLDNYDYFSLNHMGLCEDCIELRYRNDASQMELVSTITAAFA